MSDTSRPDVERSVDCKECRFGSSKVQPKFNIRRGRYCYKYSKPEVRSDLIKFENDTAVDRDGLLKCIYGARRFQIEEGVSSDLDTVMRSLGMCLWSWPYGVQELNAMWVLAKCVGEMGLTLPYPSIPLEEQPNLFFEFLALYTSARGSYMDISAEKARSRMGG